MRANETSVFLGVSVIPHKTLRSPICMLEQMATAYSRVSGWRPKRGIYGKHWLLPDSSVRLSLSNAARLSFSDLCILLFLFLSLCRLCVCVFLCSHWSLVDVPLIFFCPADHVPDW